MKIDDLIKNKLNDPEVAEEYQKEGEKLQTAISLYKARESAGLTQAELAEKANTTQATIAVSSGGITFLLKTFQKLLMLWVKS